MLAYKKRVEIKRWTTKQRCSGGNETQPPTTKHRKVTEKTSAARKHGKNINKAESYKNKNYRNEELKNQSATIKHCSEFRKCTAIGTYTIYITNCGSIVCAKWPNGPIKMQNATLRCNKKWLYFYRYQSGYCSACFYYGIVRWWRCQRWLKMSCCNSAQYFMMDNATMRRWLAATDTVARLRSISGISISQESESRFYLLQFDSQAQWPKFQYLNKSCCMNPINRRYKALINIFWVLRASNEFSLRRLSENCYTLVRSLGNVRENLGLQTYR